MTEAQRRANNKYRRKLKQIILRFYPKDTELYQKAKKLGSKGIKKLINQWN